MTKCPGQNVWPKCHSGQSVIQPYVLKPRKKIQVFYQDVKRNYWNVCICFQTNNSALNFEVSNFYVFIQNSIKLVLPRSEGIYEMQIFFGCHNMCRHQKCDRSSSCVWMIFEKSLNSKFSYISFHDFFSFSRKKRLRNLQVIERPRAFFHSSFEQV